MKTSNMKFLIRASISMVQCTRLLSRSTALSMVETKPAQNERARFNFNYFKHSDSDINKRLMNLESTIEDEHWKSMRTELLNNFELSENSVDAKLIDLMYYHKRLDAVVDYIKFLKRHNYDINLSVIAKYFKTFLRSEKLTEKEEEEICKIYDSIREKYPILDASFCTDCILALSLTKRWEDCFQLLEMMKYSDNPGVNVYAAIISAAFRNNKPEIGWEQMNAAIIKLPLHPRAYLAHLDYCKSNLKGKKLQKELEKMFNFWRDNSVTPAENVVKGYCDVYASFGYTPSTSIVSRHGKCSSCGSTLPETTLTSTEFKLLSVGVLKNCIIGSNIFCASSPQELKKYMLFIKTMTPYDVVIDGLNVAYARRAHDQKRGSLEAVLNVVKKFTREKKRVLVIGRAHMNWWNKDVMKQIEQEAQVYLVKNISQDDPYLLHVSLVSGPQTYFVSKDFMRQHKFKMDASLQNLFKRWQLSRQYFFDPDLRSNNIRLYSPISFDIAVQQNENGWHIPYTESQSLMLPNEYRQPENWICMKKNKIVKEQKSKKKEK